MPGLARKIIICAAFDGLILQPLSSKKDQRPSPPVIIRYGDASVSSTSRDTAPDLSRPNSSFEAFGVVGLITIARASYLISITRRQQVAHLRGSPIYVATEVALTPCSSHKDASDAIAKTTSHLLRQDTGQSQTAGTEDSDSDDEFSRASDEVVDASDPDENVGPPTTLPTAANASASAKSSIAEDVISRRGSYGRFAQRWFSRGGWTMEQKRNMGLSSPLKEQSSDEEPAQKGPAHGAAGGEDDREVSGAMRLLPKLLKTTQILFGASRSFFFSYDHDITRSLANPRVPDAPLQPLYNRVDPTYFWNYHILKPFMDAGADTFALPLMQGFVGQRSFIVDSQPPQVDDDAKDSVELSDFSHKEEPKPESPPSERASVDLRPSERKFDITVISRRSIKRAGLRYLRRGIDDEGYVANAVESEQILSPASLDVTSKIYSFVQIRGSIPLFFTQSPYSLRPAPVMQHSTGANYMAMTKHFDRLRQQYGKLQVVNLVEKHGIEAPIGVLYQESVERLNEEGDEPIPFEWFDFHAVCRGMKFENVSLLMQTLNPKLAQFGSTIEADGVVTATQEGVVRTNCMDCLDRTNVCQSSFAKYMLEVQLKAQGFDMSVQRDQETTWFNTLWADNGDAISKQYASTAAMKGDFTRTRKRDYRGLMTDAGLSLTRFFNGMVNDFFLQTTIDFLLGNVTSMVFEEFEANMMTKDPAVSMQKMREQAIEMSQKRVVADESEEFMGGWTLLTPHAPDSIKATRLDEAVLLLTDVALYLCRFDWNLDKVSSFERVELAHVENIKFGTYITSAMSAAQADEMRNVGLIISYRPGSNDITRTNTRSLSTVSTNLRSRMRRKGPDGSATSQPSGLVGLLARRAQTAPPPRKIALKALPQSSVADPGPGAGPRLTEIQQVVTICADIERLALLRQKSPFASSEADDKNAQTLIEKGDIISLAEARKSTGLLEQLGHSIKRMVWA